MKNCLSIIFALNLLMIAPAQASERGLAAKSRALFEVISAIEAARYDLPVSYEVRESELPLKPENCKEVDAVDVVLAFEDMVSSFQEVFPDDELPYEQAISDFSDMVGNNVYVRCEASNSDMRDNMKVISFKSVDSSFKVSFLHHQYK
ncbi:MAG: hypothetical protein COV38_15195 [Bdellovibrionales bacterium CG11_big_fil_rev_8_21_14_0_20_38_13]|nr:MAG: hypothetical protein COV38_15195 [Bdellovibrionales bacterium CG11_big_fil_rev_8_21_14_0_20_38_13]